MENLCHPVIGPHWVTRPLARTTSTYSAHTFTQNPRQLGSCDSSRPVGVSYGEELSRSRRCPGLCHARRVHRRGRSGTTTSTSASGSSSSCACGWRTRGTAWNRQDGGAGGAFHHGHTWRRGPVTHSVSVRRRHGNQLTYMRAPHRPQLIGWYWSMATQIRGDVSRTCSCWVTPMGVMIVDSAV